MPPAAKKNCSVILYDYNTKKPELAKSTVLKIMGHKWFKTSSKQARDITRIIFTNVDKTSNTLNVTKDGYENIYAATDKVNLDPMNFARVFNRKLEPSNADWIEALHVAINCLKTDFIDLNGIVSKQLLFVTDMSTPLISSQSNKLKALIRDINEYKIYLYIVGPQVTYPHTLSSIDDVNKAMQAVKFLDENENARLVKEIIANTKNTVVCPYEIGVHLFSSYVAPVLGQPWQVPLAIGTQLELPTFTIKLTDGSSSFTLEEDKSDNLSEVVWVHADDEEKQVAYSDVVKGVARHNKFVPVDSEVNAMFKCEGPRKFNLIGFTHMSKVPEYLFMGEATYVVLASPKSPEQTSALYNLIDHLGESDMYGIAIQCYYANNVPKFNVLIPKPDLNPKCFYMVQLPYKDDVKIMYNESTPTIPISEENDEIYAFLDSIDIHGDNCEINVPLTPNLLHHNTDSKIVAKALENYLDQSKWATINCDALNLHSSTQGEIWSNLLPEMKVEEESEVTDRARDDDYSDFEFQDDEY